MKKILAYTRNHLWVDKWGICVSTICLIHCLLTPVLLVILPLTSLGQWFLSEDTHRLFAILVMIPLLWAIIPHCRKHGHKDILILGLLGLSFIFTGVIFEKILGTLGSHFSTVLGSIFVIWAHWRNIKVRHGKCKNH